MTENYLSHHGVKGQKWGVRRYQNKDGSLTAAGKRKFNQVSKDSKENESHTKKAKWLLEGNSDNAKIYAKEMKEIADFNKDFGDRKGYKQYVELGKKYQQDSKKYNKMLKDIDNGVLKAGRDFITTKDKNFGDVNDRIIFKKTDAEIKKARYKIKDDKTFKKTGIKVDRDSLNRVTGLKATNASKRQIKKINKMQRSINRRGDY